MSVCGGGQASQASGPPIEEKRPQFFLFLCSSNMKRAASLNYLNQPSAAPLQVRAVLIQRTVGEKERTTPVGRGESHLG